MEDQKNSTKSIVLNYGVILGVLTVLFSVAIYAIQGINMKPPVWQRLIGYAISIAVIILGIKKFKEFNEGTLTLGQAIKTGVGIALIAGIITAIYILIFSKFIEPGMQDMILDQARENMLSNNPDMPEEQIEIGMNWTKKFTSPLVMMPLTVIGKLFTGLIVSLIGGLIMKQDESYNY